MMNHSRLFFVVIIAALVVSYPVSAQFTPTQRTFVSAASGSDANPCSRTEPCRNFAAAIALTLPGGEVIVLDSGGYGVFDINRAVNIEAPAGVFAGIAVFSGAGIEVAAGSSETVSLRGITLNGLGGSSGIDFLTGKLLHIERCAVSHLTTGISNLQAGTLLVNDTSLVDSEMSISLGNGSQLVRCLIDHCLIQGGTDGISIFQPSKVVIRNSVLAGVGETIGISVNSIVSGQKAEATVENCTVLGFTTGIRAFVSGGGTLMTRVSNSTITHNQEGVSTNDPVNAPIRSRSNNTLRGNFVDGSFNGTYGPD
jgi:hypothetical protein